jgi:hypothetical protein
MVTQIVPMAMLPSKPMVNYPEANQRVPIRTTREWWPMSRGEDRVVMGSGIRSAPRKRIQNRILTPEGRISVLTLYQLCVDGRVDIAAADYAANQPIPKEIRARHHSRDTECPGRFNL